LGPWHWTASKWLRATAWARAFAIAIIGAFAIRAIRAIAIIGIFAIRAIRVKRRWDLSIVLQSLL